MNTRRPPVFTAFLVPAVSWLLNASAAAFTWDGGSVTSNNWNDAVNWTPNGAPVSSIDTGIHFNSATARTNSTQNVAATFQLNVLFFDTASNHNTISGLTLNFRLDSMLRPPLLYQDSAPDVTINNPVLLSTSLSTGGNGGSLTLAGLVSGAGSLRKAEGFTLLLTNANTYSGGTVLDTGATTGGIGVGHNDALGSGMLTVLGNRQLFAFGGNRTLDNPIEVSSSILPGVGRLNLVAGPTGTHDLTLNGTISGEGSAVVNIPSGNITFGGTMANTFTGQTDVTAGTLVLGKTAGLLALSGHVVVGNALSPGAPDSAAVQFNANNQTGAATNVTVFADGLFNVNGRTTAIGSLTMTAGETRLVNGVLRLNGDVVINGTAAGSQITSTDFNNDLNLNNAARTFAVANGAALYDLDVQAGVTAGTLVKTGEGSMRLAGNFNTNLSVTLQSGSLAVGNNAALGTSGGTFTLSGGIVRADGADRTVSNPINVAGDAMIGSSIDGTPRALTFSGATSLAADTRLTVSNSAVTTFTNVISGAGSLVRAGAGTLTLNNAANTFSGGLTINGGTVNAANDGSLGAAANVVTLNAGRLNFTGLNVTTARTFFLNNAAILAPAPGGTLTYAAGAAVHGGNLGASGNHLFSGGSSLSGTTSLIGSALNQTGGTVAFDNVTLRGSFTQAPGATLTATSGLTLTSSGALSIFGTTNLANGGELNGVAAIQNGGTLASAGSNLFLGGGSRTTLFANGALTAAAGTSIELNGGLLVNNGLQSGALNVNFGGVAKGAGVFGSVNVTDGGTFSPGNSPGLATLESLSFTSGGHYEFELNSALAVPGSGADFLNVLGPVTLAAGDTAATRFTISLISLDEENRPAALEDFDASRAYEFPLLAAESISGFDAEGFTVDLRDFGSDLAGGSFAVEQTADARGLVLHFIPVPEPGAAALLLAGAALLATRAYRKGRTNRP